MYGKKEKRDSEYTKQARDFLAKTGTTLRITYIDEKPVDWDNYYHDCYKVMVRKGHKQFSINFYESLHNTRKEIRPDAYDILACLSGDYFEGSIDDFVNEFGYEVHSWADVKKIERTYKAVCKETKSIKRLYTPEEIEMLLEIR